MRPACRLNPAARAPPMARACRMKSAMAPDSLRVSGLWPLVAGARGVLLVAHDARRMLTPQRCLSSPRDTPTDTIARRHDDQRMTWTEHCA